MRSFLSLLAAAAVAGVSAAGEAGYAMIRPTASSPDAAGWVTFTSVSQGNTSIEYSVSGLTPGLHAMHVHMYGDLTDEGALSTGGHYNPQDTDHGCYPSASRHAGDLFNITVAEDGTANGTHYRDLISVDGDYSAIGRALIIHAMYDNCEQPTGNAGARHAMGIIGIKQESGNLAKNSDDFNYLKAVLYPTTGNTAYGNVTLKKIDNGASVNWYAHIVDVEPNSVHGLHIHEFGDASADDGTSAGGHWNPTGNDHSNNASNPNRHQGDLGNVVADANGVIEAWGSFSVLDQVSTTSRWQAFAGRAFILHAAEDDGEQPTGNAGSRLAIGVIGNLDDTADTGYYASRNIDFFPAQTFSSSSSSSSSSSTGSIPLSSGAATHAPALTFGAAVTAAALLL